MGSVTELFSPIIWKGAEQLRPFIVPIDQIEPYEGNPRRGDIGVVVESFERFGQVTPVLTMGGKIIAGHARTDAARALGWTHVAVIEHEFADEAEAERYLLMDNRSHDRGAYELEELHEHLAQLKATEGGLAGTGYEESYYRSLERDLERFRVEAEPPPFFPPLDPETVSTDFQCPHCQYQWSGSPRPNG
jgi:hypothetical protein